MFYKLFRYNLERSDVVIAPDKHLQIFRQGRGPDVNGDYAVYRGQANAVLMHVRKHGDYFIGRIGKHSTEREIIRYDASSDVAEPQIVNDDDYPSAPFICYPDLGMVACVDGTPIDARSAMKRLHAVLVHRTRAVFTFLPICEAGDLRLATRRFRVVQIDYEVFPVNPHTGDLGLRLDDGRKRDHIQKMAGKLVGSAADPIKLNGGFATQIQQLQASGHSRVGYTAQTKEGIEIKVQKPKEPEPLNDDADSGDAASAGANFPEVRISFPGLALEYPLPVDHLEQIVNIMRKFAS